MNEDRSNIFTQSVIQISRCASSIKDPFLADLLFSGLGKYIESYIIIEREFENGISDIVKTNFENRVESLIEWLNVVEHYKLSDSVSPVLSKKYLLQINLEVSKLFVDEKDESPKVIITSTNNQLKKDVLDFINSSGGTRAVDVRRAFPDVSDRTIFRILKELLMAEAIEKSNGPGKAVSYSPKNN